jgi:hypothetical protein
MDRNIGPSDAAALGKYPNAVRQSLLQFSMLAQIMNDTNVLEGDKKDILALLFDGEEGIVCLGSRMWYVSDRGREKRKRARNDCGDWPRTTDQLSLIGIIAVTRLCYGLLLPGLQSSRPPPVLIRRSQP